MPGPYSRRHLLRIGSGSALAATAALAGCTGSRSNSSCELTHEVSTRDETTDHSGETIPYENLSPEGKDAFETALESNSSAYVITYDGDNKPPDFSYSDEVTVYVVEYEGEQYTLRTYTGEGCVIG